METLYTNNPERNVGYLTTHAPTSGSVVTSRLKFYVGGLWVAKPLKQYIGGIWTEKTFKRYNGVSWV